MPDSPIQIPSRPRLLILALSLALAFSASSPASPGLAAGPPLAVATEGAYPPFSFLDSSGQAAGYDVDLTMALCRRMGRACTVVAEPWETIIQGLLDRRYDVIVAQMAKTPEREKVLVFTAKYCSSRSAFVGRPGKAAGSSPRELAGLTLATQAGTFLADHLASQHATFSPITLTSTTEESFDLLVRGQADVVLTDSLVILEFLQSPRGQGFEFIGAPLPPDDTYSAAYIAVRKGDERLRDELDQALRDIRMNGEYDRISRRYFPFSTY